MNSDFGYRGSVAVGTRLLIDDAEITGPGSLSLESPPRTGELVVEVKIGEPECSGVDDSLPCPARHDAALRFAVSGLLDWRKPLDLGESVRFTQHAGDGARVFAFEMPELPAGAHCLAVFALEDASDVVGGQFADHSSATLYEMTVGNGGVDHCDPARTERALTVDREGGCTYPLLSVAPTGREIRRTIADGESVHITVPHCAGTTVALLLHNGKPAEAAGSAFALDPAGGELTEGRHVLSARTLDTGSWRLAVFHELARRGRRALLSPPVVVTP